PVPAPRSAADVSLTTQTSHPPIREDVSPASAGSPVQVRRRSGGRRSTAARAVAELQAELAELVSREPGVTVEITWRVVDA
ncbi:hypothetical protein, partial [Streptomyces alboverticillatus]